MLKERYEYCRLIKKKNEVRPFLSHRKRVYLPYQQRFFAFMHCIIKIIEQNNVIGSGGLASGFKRLTRKRKTEDVLKNIRPWERPTGS